MAAADQSRTPDDCLWLVAGTGSSGPEHPRHFEYCLSFDFSHLGDAFSAGSCLGSVFFSKTSAWAASTDFARCWIAKNGNSRAFRWNHVGTMLEPDVREGKKHAREGKKQAPGGKKQHFLLEPPFLDREPGKKARPDRKKVWELQNLAKAMLEPCWNHVGTMLEPCWNHGSLVGCFFLNFVVFFVSGPCFFPVYPSGPLSIRDMPCLGPNPGRFGVVHQRAVHIKGETRTVPGSKCPWHRPAFSFLFDLCQGQTS